MMKSVFDLDFGGKTGEKPKSIMLSQLQQVKLLWLEELTRIIMHRGSDDEIVVGFPSLKHLEASGCSKLIDLIITRATATTLLKLETLYIFGSEDLQEVIHGEVRDKNKRNIISFPHLTSLTIFALDKLTHFSSMSYLLDLKCLKVLHISTCASFKTMVNPRPEGRQGSLDHEDEAHTATDSLFNDKVELPNLEELHVNEIQVEALWCNEPRRGSFCKLKFLYVNLCERLQYIIPSLMIKRLQNLEHLKITLCYSLEDIFKVTSTQPIQPQDSRVLERQIVDVGKDIGGNIQEETGRRTIRLTKLICLELENIKLSNVWLGSYTLELPSLKKLTGTDTSGVVQAIIQKVNLPNLEELEIAEERVEELWHSEPPVESFYRLKHLKVESCHKLIKIFPSFMLKRLQNLEKLVVKDCKSLNIVFELDDVVGEISESSKYEETTSDDSTDNRIITLPQLTNLTLEGLTELIHLFGQGQGKYTLELMSLKEFFLVGSGDKEATTQKVVFPNKLQVKMYNFFGSQTTVLEDLMKALQNNNQVIGLLGVMDMGLYIALTDRLKEEPILFDKYYRLYIPKNAHRIQEKIGEELISIIYSEPGEEGRAQCLRKSLLSNQDKRLLLILHNLSEEFDIDLEDVGIPHKQLDPKLFKIILISENRERMIKMGTQEIINIGRKVGLRWIYIHRQRESMAEELAHECGSDDLARILNEKLRWRTTAECEDALQRLKESAYEYEARKRIIDSLNWPDLSNEDSPEAEAVVSNEDSSEAESIVSNEDISSEAESES